MFCIVRREIANNVFGILLMIFLYPRGILLNSLWNTEESKLIEFVRLRRIRHREE
jgi:hypothetical protein